jgi:flagellar assembly protein FliH
MVTVIKAAEHNSVAAAVAFNFQDLAVQAKAYLDRVQADAAGIVAKAQQEAVAIRQRAEQEGRAAGHAVVAEWVQRETQTRLTQQLQTLLPALSEVVQDLRHARHTWLAHWEKTAVRLAIAIAARVLRRPLPEAPPVALGLVREALELAAGSPQIRIHLNPADHQTLAGQVQLLLAELATVGVPEVLADPGVTAGGCRVETRFGVIDQQFEAQLARIEEELT